MKKIINKNMKIKKIKDVKTPTRGTKQSAGIDFYVPTITTELSNYLNKEIKYKYNSKSFELKPNEAINIPSGIVAEIPQGYALIAMNKSGVSLKGLQVGACVIDSDYRGEIHLHVFNYTDKNITIEEGQKLVQFLLIPYLNVELEIVEDIISDTERGSNGFGSTGLK